MKGEVTAPLVWIFFVYVISHGYINSIVQTILTSVNFNPSSTPSSTDPGNFSQFHNIFGGPATPPGNQPLPDIIPGNPSTNPNTA
ncbi:MAG: hypothetical protein JWM85_3599 [Acidimicrobiaceae bacterium]|nr:hypothetical protein [Acidimicrobiaceae bacterium]